MKKIGKLTLQDGFKSIRDAFLIAAGGLLPQLLDILGTVDFGEYTNMVSIGLAMLMPLANRFLRNK